MSITETMTVNQVIQTNPATLPVLKQFGIDACCGGAKTLAFVAEKHGFQLAELIEQLERAGEGVGAGAERGN
jgi:iron-sulfur cluster repair protein YtfE (RIC family)